MTTQHQDSLRKPVTRQEIIDALNAQAGLLACYRIGRQPSAKILDGVGKANDLRYRLMNEEMGLGNATE